MDPILHCARCVTQHARCFAATNAMSYQQHAVKAVIISRLIRTTDFVLQCEDYCFGITNLQWLHSHIEAQRAYMRNYL